jgi:hypothetical protein
MSAMVEVQVLAECLVCGHKYPIQDMLLLNSGEHLCDAPECRGVAVKCDRCEEWFHEDDCPFERSGIRLCRSCEPFADAFAWEWIEQ